MYALSTDEGSLGRSFGAPRQDGSRGAVPYCFILDDQYRVIMAGPSGDDDPLAPLYSAESGPDALPSTVDRVVRALTASWRSTTVATSVSAAVSDVQVTVAPLHGFDGRRIAVFVSRLEV